MILTQYHSHALGGHMAQVAIDYFTNWVEAAVMKTLIAEKLIRTFFKIIISRHGCPAGLMSYSGSQLKYKFEIYSFLFIEIKSYIY